MRSADESRQPTEARGRQGEQRVGQRGGAMPSVVSISDIVAAMDLPNQDWESFLDPESGEIITVTEEDRRPLDHPKQERPFLVALQGPSD